MNVQSALREIKELTDDPDIWIRADELAERADDPMSPEGAADAALCNLADLLDECREKGPEPKEGA